MNIKILAIVYCVLISCEYVRVSAFEHQLPASVSRDKRSTSSCSIDPQVTVIVDEALDRCRSRISARYVLQDHSTSEIRVKGGFCEGWGNFHRSSQIAVTCQGDVILIPVEISFLSITVTYTLTLLENLLTGVLGQQFSSILGTIGSLIGNVVSFLLRVLATDIRVVISLEQKLVSGARCSVVSYEIARISNIKILNLDLTSVANILEGLLGPVLNLVLNVVVTGPIKLIFVEELSQISIPLNLINLRL